MNKQVGFWAITTAGLIALVLAGCGVFEKTEPARTLTKSHASGPLKVTLEVTPDEITLADKLRLHIRADILDGWDLELPSFEEKIGAFRILEMAQEESLSDKGSRTYLQDYTLDLFLSDEVVIPMLVFSYHRTGKKETQSLKTEPITLKLRAVLLEEGEPKMRPMTGPVALAAPFPWLLLVGAFALLAILFACAAIWRKRKKNRPAPPAPSPYETASHALIALMAKSLAPELFVDELTWIIRRYVEAQFHIRAPRRTTEEFLAEAAHSSLLEKEHQAMLGRFLGEADLVKFARSVPGETEIDNAYQTAKGFLEDTRHVSKPDHMESAA